MRKVLFALLALLIAVPVLAADLTDVSRPYAVTVAPQPSQPLTLQRGLDKNGKNIVEFWFRERDGNKQKRYCDFDCTVGLYYAYNDCRNAGGSHDQCCLQWQQNIVYCCPGEPPPSGCDCPDGLPPSYCT